MPVSRRPGTGDCCAGPSGSGMCGGLQCRQATPGRPAGKPGVLPSIRRGGEPVPAGDAPPQPLHRGGTPGEQRPPLSVRDPGATTVRGDDAGRLMAGVSGRGCAGGRCNLGCGCHRVTASGRQRFPGRAHVLARPSAKVRPGAASPHHRGAVCADAALPQEAPRGYRTPRHLHPQLRSVWRRMCPCRPAPARRHADWPVSGCGQPARRLPGLPGSLHQRADRFYRSRGCPQGAAAAYGLRASLPPAVSRPECGNAGRGGFRGGSARDPRDRRNVLPLDVSPLAGRELTGIAAAQMRLFPVRPR